MEERSDDRANGSWPKTVLLYVFLDSLNNSYINLKRKNGQMIDQIDIDQKQCFFMFF